MAAQTDMISLTILRQREALYQIHKQFGISRTDLEILAFTMEKVFFTLYDLQKFYSHTNVQQMRKSLKKLASGKFIQQLSMGIKNKPTNYGLLKLGKQAIKQYTEIILNGIEPPYK
jgi:hypothetical protein